MIAWAILSTLLAFGGWGAFWCIEDQVKELRAERDEAIRRAA